MAEIFGREEGYCRGRSGSMHMADKELGLLGANGIVGGGIPIATGAAFASRYKKDGGVTVCFFGEGATSEGTFHESLNLASLFKLPIIFVCENNEWAQFTPRVMQMPIGQVSVRAKAYNVKGVFVENNPVDIYRAASKAFDRARKGLGPTLLEIKMHRWFGHFVGDQQKYRSPQDIETARQKDCLRDFENLLKKEKILDKRMCDAILEEINQEIKDAVIYAEGCKISGPEDVLKDVYAS
jgi:TPP-dependent pyruvate/acetoin dehydrogenase alpha subunit